MNYGVSQSRGHPIWRVGRDPPKELAGSNPEAFFSLRNIAFL